MIHKETTILEVQHSKCYCTISVEHWTLWEHRLPTFLYVEISIFPMPCGQMALVALELHEKSKLWFRTYFTWPWSTHWSSLLTAQHTELETHLTYCSATMQNFFTVTLHLRQLCLTISCWTSQLGTKILYLNTAVEIIRKRKVGRTHSGT